MINIKSVGFEFEDEAERQYYINEAINTVKCNEEDIELIVVTLADTDGLMDIEVRTKDNVKFERIRRITGYLVGSTDRWNDAKRAELADRVKHI